MTPSRATLAHCFMFVKYACVETVSTAAGFLGSTLVRFGELAVRQVLAVVKAQIVQRVAYGEACTSKEKLLLLTSIFLFI